MSIMNPPRSLTRLVNLPLGAELQLCTVLQDMLEKFIHAWECKQSLTSQQ